MGRRSKSALDLLLIGTTRLSWPVGIGTAIVVFVAFRWLSLQQLASVDLDNSFIPTLMWNVFIHLSTVLQWLLPALILVGVLAGFIRRGRQLQLVDEMRQSGAAGLGSLNWRQFEELLAGYFRTRGFTVASNPDNGPDGGVDLRLRRGNELHLVQCKHWRARKVPVSTVRELFGVMTAEGAAGGFVVTSGQFTDDAVEFANGRNIELIDGRTLQARLESEAVEGGARAVGQSIGAPTPECPRCGEPMARRTARRGANAGSDFWGCSRYPNCRATQEIRQ